MKSYYLAKLLYKMRLSSFKKCSIDDTSRVDALCVLAYVRMGKYSYVGSETHITSAEIGNFVSIGGKCQIGGGEHQMNLVSTSPVFGDGRNIMRKNFSNIPSPGTNVVHIENDVWIGDGCYIKAGVNVGNGAIIGAHAVVTHDVEPFSIVAGCPANLIRYRFPEGIIRSLNEIKWWDWEDSKIEAYAEYFDNPIKLIDKLKGEDL